MYTEKELGRKKIADLRRIAADLGIEYDKRWIRTKFIKEILNKQAGVGSSTTIYSNGSPAADQQPANPEFEQAAAEKAAEPVKDNRGGARPGAGRPLGLTDEKAKVKNLPKFASQPIYQGVCSLFDLWGSVAKIEELALSEEEADLLSLPLTQLQEYYFPGILPEIAGTWIMLIFATTRIMKPRIKMINKVREQRHAAKDKRPEPTKDDKIIRHFVDPHGKGSQACIHPLEPSPLNDYTTDAKKVTCETCIKILSQKAIS